VSAAPSERAGDLVRDAAGGGAGRAALGREVEGMINDSHNSFGGTMLSIFYRTQRVLDGDQFWVNVMNA
jgi:hypothetical protein